MWVMAEKLGWQKQKEEEGGGNRGERSRLLTCLNGMEEEEEGGKWGLRRGGKRKHKKGVSERKRERRENDFGEAWKERDYGALGTLEREERGKEGRELETVAGKSEWRINPTG